MKTTVLTLKEQKQKGDKITMLTAYDYSTAKIMDEAGIECLLVGDSLGMVMLGYDSTIPVTMADMLHHTKAVARGAKNALVVADMPFMSYQVSAEDAVRNAGRLMQEGGAQAVKLEGGIGAGAGCDGQVLVYQDMLALYSDMCPKFVRRFADAGEVMRQGFRGYIDEVKAGSFPTEEHSFKMPDEVLSQVEEMSKAGKY